MNKEKTTKRDTKGRVLKAGEIQDKNGRYRYRYMKDGVRHQIYSWKLVPTDKTPNGKEDGLSLREKELQLLRDIHDNINTKTAKLYTVEQWVQKYLKSKSNLAQSTKENYLDMLKSNITTNEFGKLRLDNVKTSDVKEYYSYLYEKKGFSFGTIQLYQNLLFPAFQLAIDDDIIRKNPCTGALKNYTYIPNERNALSIAEEKELLQYAKSNKFYKESYLSIYFILMTGLRISEYQGIRWDDINFETDEISVNHQCIYRRIDGKMKWYASVPKNKTSRIVPLHPQLKELLLEKYKKDKYNSLCSEFEVDGYKNFVFLNNNSKLATPGTLDRTLRMLVSKHNQELENDTDVIILPNTSAHILRHTFCTRMAEAGMDIKVLQQIMGHKNIGITMDVYNHINDERLRKEALRIFPLSTV